MNFSSLFTAATGHPPYGYQCRLAGSEGTDPEGKFDHGAECRSQLISIPTGLGKTAAVVLAWLWNRVHLKLRTSDLEPRTSPWPRRLVYCLPMRTLVEQTEREVRKWLLRLARKHTKPRDGSELRWLALHSPIVLMGGEDLERAKRDWDLHPERPAILIGTQDMLLSRALNRGYGMSRYRWPMHFGLLNNDCLWVMDETQLMGVGVETSAQLDGFRGNGKLPTLGICPTWWMSATLDDSRLSTVDHPKPDGWPVMKLSDDEKTAGRPKALFTAPKKLTRAPLELTPATKKEYAKQLANLIKDRHHSGTLTLIVVNRVSRAREVFEALTTGKKPLYDKPENVALIHSRFRPVDRERHTKLLFGSGDRVVVATQAVEAGVDVSARLLITELAPWSSMVQRIGRCNRYADMADAEVLWVDIVPKDEKDDLLLPYAKSELDKARAALVPLTEANPQTLQGVTVVEEKSIRPVIRRRDLVDLFDTTPDLCGQDLDISRYIRDGEDNDVQFFWRDITGEALSEQEPAPARPELCRVSIGDAAKFLGKKPRAWRWNPLSEEWEPATHARPGGVYLVDAKAGGYDDTTGWTGDPKDKPTSHPPEDGAHETYAGNPLALAREWQTIAAHTAHVIAEAEHLTRSLALGGTDAASLRLAALWHDVGKAHAEFQKMLRDGPHQPADSAAFYAKSKNLPSPSRRTNGYRSLRHELASALAWLLSSPPDTPEQDLIAYLIAAHHGKVRLSIRSLPNEPAPGDDRLFARGIWDGDELLAVPIGQITTPPVTLDLSFMQMGEGPHGPSWLARAVAVRDRLGPFRLAYLESVLRAADARASRIATT
jgi:CRISPR-associated endonuclease/helicase Cas3